MAVMTLNHLVQRGIRALGTEANQKRIGANPVMERASATVSFARRQSQRYLSAVPCDPCDRSAAVRAGRPGSASVVPVSGSPARMLWRAGRWLASGKPATPACRAQRGRPDVMRPPTAGWTGHLGRIHAGLTGGMARSGAFTTSLRGKGAR
jgi:hypothetical protein